MNPTTSARPGNAAGADEAQTPMTEIRIVVFDVLGTVLDERGSFRAATRLALPHEADPVALADKWLNETSTTVSRIAHGTEPWQAWDQVIANRLRDLTPDPAAHRALSSIGHRLTAWPDSAAALERIHAKRHTVALSNAGATALMDCARNNALTWSTVLSAEMVRTAKPDPKVYTFLLDTLHVDPTAVLFVAAHPWDLRAAALHGMHTAYIERPTEDSPAPDGRFDWTGTDLLELAHTLDGPTEAPR